MVVLIDGSFSFVANHVKKNYTENHPLWNCQFLISERQAVIETHKDYIRAGADIITTNTYQASIEGFQKYLDVDANEAGSLIKNAVLLAHQAIEEEKQQCQNGKQVKIAGSVGPYGACLHDGSEYTGDYCDHITEEELMNWHRPRFLALIEGEIDLFAIETIPALKEALVLCDLLKEFPNKKAWLSFSCKDEKYTCHGEIFKDAVNECWKRNPKQLLAVGMNCLNPVFVTTLLKSLDDHNLPIIVYPNSGEIWDHDKGWCHPENVVSPLNFLPEWIKLGVNYIGGCCRTTPADIKTFRDYIDTLN